MPNRTRCSRRSRSPRSPGTTWSAAIALALVAAPIAGCAAQQVDVRQLQLPAPAAASATKSALPLHIVLDPARVPASIEATGGDVKPVTVDGLHAFVERDLRNALSSVFTSVDVVPPNQSYPDQYYLLAEVEITQLRFMSTGGGSQTAGRLEWTFRLRAAGRDQHIYQTTGTTGPAVGKGDVEAAIAGVLEAAVDKVMTAYVERDIVGRVARLEQSLPR